MKRTLLAILILAFPNDRFKRILGVVFVDVKNVNLEMVKVGLAKVYLGSIVKEFDSGPY